MKRIFYFARGQNFIFNLIYSEYKLYKPDTQTMIKLKYSIGYKYRAFPKIDVLYVTKNKLKNNIYFYNFNTLLV